MVYRIYSEKKPGVSPESGALLAECVGFLGIGGLKKLRILNRYDVENISAGLFERAKTTVFSEPQVDDICSEPNLNGADAFFAVEPLPGQFDQRADSAAQCIQLMHAGERPLVRSAKVYVLYGDLSPEDVDKVKRYVINPVESREASFDLPDTLRSEYPVPADIRIVEGFTSMDSDALGSLRAELGLAMDADDLAFLQAYFRDEEHRDPTLTEIRVVDTYWSDHCRHTTFSTRFANVQIEDEDVRAAYQRYLDARVEVYGGEAAARRPQTLMDIATIGAKVLKKRGLLPELDESEEINACSIRVPIEVDGEKQDWLLMFKNETHNHPTEIEPFGGAATCIGGCIRDPLSGRAYVHQAMRVTGAGDPRRTLAETLPGKLPQRKLCQTAAAGYSSYGNQIGLATGHVAEIYHDGYVAKRLECGVVVAAAPADHVKRERPVPGDIVILLGGRTGRDGIGGATGSSKSHDMKSLTTMASEVQKGNAPEERKIQRLFRNADVTRRIKRCNDFGAGGVSVAVGELADGLRIDLDAVRKKYEGLDGTELAISESQERMAVVVAPEDRDAIIRAAAEENLEAYPVAVVTEEPRMVMTWRNKVIVDMSRAFLSTNGAVKHCDVYVPAGRGIPTESGAGKTLRETAESLACASRRGLVERFDSTVGAGSILMPFGGRTQRTPTQAMAALFPVLPGSNTEDGSVMAWGFDPDWMEADCYRGARESVYRSLASLTAAGGDHRRAYLSFQEFFERMGREPARWGKPFAALLGALDAQLELGRAAIGGKDSMSGTFLDLDVPPTLISFAIAPARAGDVLSPEFKGAGHPVVLFRGDDAAGRIAAWDAFLALHREGTVLSAWAVEHSLAEGIMKMSFGNGIGFEASEKDVDWYAPVPGGIVAELSFVPDTGTLLGYTTERASLRIGGEDEGISRMLKLNESVLAEVYPVSAAKDVGEVPALLSDAAMASAPHVRTAKPRVLIPAFPGTNCEYDSRRAVMDAGGEAEISVIRNLTADDVARSVERFAEGLKDVQMIFLPGGFSGGDEPEGSAKFITAFFRNPAVKEQTELLLDRGGLILGICNGFQALVKLGLVPYGRITDTDEASPTLTYNTIGRHQSRMVRTRVCSKLSPWLSEAELGGVYTVPISHGEGRFFASEEMVRELASRGQIATQYCDENGAPSMITEVNPNGSVFAVEGITSPDGRVLGKMGHSERIGASLYRNVEGRYDIGLFRSAVKYFSEN